CRSCHANVLRHMTTRLDRPAHASRIPPLIQGTGNSKLGTTDMPILEKIAETHLWKSVFRHPMPTDRRNRVVVMLTNFFLHLHPVSVRKQGIALSYTWCMGGTTFFLLMVEVVTGVLLMLYSPPTLEHAHNDLLALRQPTT